MTNTCVILASRPHGMPTAENFRIEQRDVPAAAPGEVTVAIDYLSLDPYMRGRMNDAKSYVEPFAVGDVLGGGGVGRVLSSNSPKFAVGDHVEGMLGWQQVAVVPDKGLRKLDPAPAPLSLALGPLGMPGLTAYFGFLEICAPKAGETVVVSGAAGAVGSYVGQIAKIKGCRVVGIAGGEEKCRIAREEFGFDEMLDYKSTTDYYRALKQLCPNGIDCYFDNVGGTITDAVVAQMNTFGRISICGQISQYNNTQAEIGPKPFTQILIRQLKVEGFIVLRFYNRAAEGLAQMAEWLGQGKLRYRETVVDGIENAPEAFIGLLKGANIGKMLVRVSPA